MKKKTWIITLVSVLLVGGLFSCAGDEEPNYGDGDERKERLEPGTALLQVAIENSKKINVTYAVTDFSANEAEKEIRSIAIFTKTDDVGTFNQNGFLLGAFNKFFSTEEVGAPWGLYDPLTDTGGGSYTVSVKVKSEGFGPKTKVLAIANYAENGLTEELMKVTRWEDLGNIRTPAATGNLTAPLLMIGTPDADVDLADQTTKTPAIKMRRVVSRIDVVNMSHDENDAKKGFRLESAQVMQPRSYSYLLEGNEFKPEVPVLASFEEVLAANAPDNDPTQVTCLYVYETDNDGPSDTKTFVRLKGQLFGMPYTKDIPLKEEDISYTEPGDPIPMLRNHRYVIKIIAAEEQGPIDWEFVIADWSDGEVIDIDPTVYPPEISAPDLSDATAANWNAATKTYTFDTENPEKLRFTVTSLRTPILSLDFEWADPSMIGLEDAGNQAYKDFLKREAPVVTYAKIEQTFEISTPVIQDRNYTVPILIKLYLHDATDKFYKDSIKFKFIPKYLDTEYQPVLVGGKYWAPVNVGAKTVEMTEYTVNTVGYYYQWGRNVPFDPLGSYTYTGRQVTDEEAHSEAYKDIFITAPASFEDWILSSDIAGIQARDRRWNIDNNSPCPKGWRIPNNAQMQELNKRFDTANITSDRLLIRGDEYQQSVKQNNNLYIPHALGFRNRADGLMYWKIANNAITSHFWTSDFSRQAYMWYFRTDGVPLNDIIVNSNGNAFPLRCIQHIP